jgi:predicted nucleic acid-binding protein
MPAEAFFDTSVLVYLLVKDDPRSLVTEGLLTKGGTISVQVLNEFVSVARRKTHMSWEEIEAALADVRFLSKAVVPLTVTTHEAALQIAKRYKFQIYDAQIIAAAIAAGCSILYSEDMQHGQKIGSLTIKNPFRAL